MAQPLASLSDVLPFFGRHETFAPRITWFKKTFDRVHEDGTVFQKDDATLRLGVGKNMVRSMRFWAGAAALVSPRRLTRLENLVPTHLASVVFSDDGWDPYLENRSTLWLLHWQMLSPPCHLPVWHFAFNHFHSAEFTADSISKQAAEAIPVLYELQKSPAPSSVRRDAECLIHTYARRIHERVLFDDDLACPFRGLGLIEPVTDRTSAYRFKVGRKTGLHDDVILFAALDFASRHVSGGQSVSIGRLLRSPNSPGRIFQLDEESMLEALTRAAQRHGSVQVVDTAGVSAVQFTSRPEVIAVRVINRHFSKSGTTQRLRHLRESSDMLAALEDAKDS